MPQKGAKSGLAQGSVCPGTRDELQQWNAVSVQIQASPYLEVIVWLPRLVLFFLTCSLFVAQPAKQACLEEAMVPL